MIENIEERELSDAELEAANISGALLGHHWHLGRGFGFGGLGLGLGLGLGGFGGGFGGGFVQQPTYVLEQQPQVVEVVQPQYVQTVSTVQATSGQCATALATGTC